MSVNRRDGRVGVWFRASSCSGWVDSGPSTIRTRRPIEHVQDVARVCLIRCACRAGAHARQGHVERSSAAVLELGVAQLARPPLEQLLDQRRPGLVQLGPARRSLAAASRSPRRARTSRLAAQARRCARPRSAAELGGGGDARRGVGDAGLEVHSWLGSRSGVTSATTVLGRRYDAWCRSVDRGHPFYVDLAPRIAAGRCSRSASAPGRVAVPTALAGVPVVGVDSVARRCSSWRGDGRRRTTSSSTLVHADMRDLPDLGTFALVTVPFRAFLHLRDDGERLAVLRALHERLRPGGTLAFDVFHPDRVDIDETHDRWMEREPGIDERARWDEAGRRLVLSVRADDVVAEMELWWVDPGGWRALLERAGFERISGPRLVRPAAARARRHRLRLGGASRRDWLGWRHGHLSRHLLGRLSRSSA